jgi:drug/metabolite transporter superfamily protein YnfA
MDLFLATTAASKRHTQEIGLLIAAIGGVFIILSAAFGLRSMSRMVERATMILAGILITVGLIVQFVAVHSK